MPDDHPYTPNTQQGQDLKLTLKYSVAPAQAKTALQATVALMTWNWKVRAPPVDMINPWSPTPL